MPDFHEIVQQQFQRAAEVMGLRADLRDILAYPLKIIQEIVTLLVFVGFVLVYLREPLRWNYSVSMVLRVAAAWFAFSFGARPQGAGS